MTRLLSSLQLDVTLQQRNKYYVIVGALVLFGALLMVQFFGADRLSMERGLPILMMFAISGTGAVYIAGLVIYEKMENTLEALTVTPLRVTEYLNSKVFTMTLLIFAENLAILGLVYVTQHGTERIQFVPWVIGVVLLGIFSALAGFILVVRYTSSTDFLIPSLFMLLIFQLPFLPFLGMAESPLFYLLPTMPQTILINGMFQPLTAAEWLYGVGYSVVLVGVLYRWALHAFHYHIVMKAG